MNRISAEIAKEIAMLFQHDGAHARAGEEQPRDHTRGTSADDQKIGLRFRPHRR
jgi:hypothetical protein